MSEPMALPTQPPAPINPKQPVRGLGEWLNYLGFMVMGYRAARKRVSAIVWHEAETAPIADLLGPGGDEDYDPTHPVTKWVAGKLRVYSDAKVRAKVAEDGIMPKLANIANGISYCMTDVEPFVDGINKHLGAIGKDPAAWETELALMLRKMNGVIAVDRFFLEHETFDDPDYFRQKTKAVDDDLSAFQTELGAKVDSLACVALPTVRRFPPGRPFQAWEEFRSIIVSATDCIRIEDAYLRSDVVAMIEGNLPEGVRLLVLGPETDNKHWRAALASLKVLGEEMSGRIEVRCTTDVHDRYIYVDGKAWRSSESFGQMAKKRTTKLVPEANHSEAYADFEKKWSEARKVYPV